MTWGMTPHFTIRVWGRLVSFTLLLWEALHGIGTIGAVLMKGWTQRLWRKSLYTLGLRDQ